MHQMSGPQLSSNLNPPEMVKGEVNCRVKQRRLASAECMGKTFTRLLETSEGDDQVMKAWDGVKVCERSLMRVDKSVKVTSV